jgi:hypothetical protein
VWGASSYLATGAGLRQATLDHHYRCSTAQEPSKLKLSLQLAVQA